MLTEYIALLPEIVLLIGILTLIIVRIFRHSNTPKTFYSLSRIFIFIAALATAVFYNRNIGDYIHNNSFTTLFKILIYLFTFIICYLSAKRFVSKNMPSFMFYITLLFNLLGFSIAISAYNMALLCGGLSLTFIANVFLIMIEKPQEEHRHIIYYLALSLAVAAAMVTGVVGLQYYFHTLQYNSIEQFLEVRSNLIWQHHFLCACIMGGILLMMGVAPFHFWFSNVVGKCILPVAGYLSVVPIFAYFSCLVNVCVNAFYPLLSWFNTVFIAFGILSIFIGAIGANSENNLRKIFAFSGLYYIGVTLLVLFPINDNNLMSSFTYMLVYAVAMCGIYTVFYGYRSKGKYMFNLGDIKGVATQRPFLSAALLVFMISLIGTPPLLGFLGKLSVINSLVIGHRFILLSAILFSMLILAYAYLKIITVVYFEPRDNTFDIVDKGVYWWMFINVVIMLLAVINPKYLMHDVELMLVAVF